MNAHFYRMAFAASLLLGSLTAHGKELPAAIQVFVLGEPDAEGRPAHTQSGIPKIIDLVSHQSGLPLVAQPLPWRRALKMAEAGEGLLYGAEATPDRLQKFVFSSSLGAVNQWLLSTEQAPLVFHQWDDLRNKRISTMSGASYGEQFEQRRGDVFKVEQNATNMASQVKMLRAGRVDAVIVASLLPPAQLENKLNCLFPGESRLVIRGRPFEADAMTFGVARNSPLMEKLPALNASIQHIVRDGLLAKLFASQADSTPCQNA